MRVVGGRLRGRNLASPSTREIRPTADRLRESVFNILMHAYDNPIEGARVLDLFAGTGTRHRGDLARREVRAVRRQWRGGPRAAAQQCGVAGLRWRDKVYRRDATDPGPAHPVEPFSLVFLDPPYGKGLAERRPPRCATAAG